MTIRARRLHRRPGYRSALVTAVVSAAVTLTASTLVAAETAPVSAAGDGGLRLVALSARPDL